MSLEKNKSKDKSSKSCEKEQILLGKKTESTNSVDNLLEEDFSNKHKCKICGKKNNLIKCSKCFYYYCKGCIKQSNRINLNKLKGKEYICSSCQNYDNLKKKRKESFSAICYICGNKYNEKNISNININSEDNRGVKNEFLSNKDILLAEKEDNLTNSNNIKWSIKICGNCQKQKNELMISKNTDKRNQIKKSSNIFDEFKSIMSKDKEETNIFNILDNESENSSENNINENKNKKQELFDSSKLEKQINKFNTNQYKK